MFEFGVLGPLIVHRDGRPVVLSAPMLRRLLAVLLIRAGRPVQLSDLLDALWDGRPPPSARKTLQVYVHRLRRELQGAQNLRHGPLGYSLTVDRTELDLLRFVDLADRGLLARRSGLLEEAGELLRQGLSLWRGTALADVSDVGLLATEATRLEQQRLQVYEEYAEVELELGRHADVVVELEELTRSQPFRERLRGQAMLALYRTGRRADALSLYRDARRQFTEELGIEPGAALQQLHAAMLRRHDGTLDVVTTRGAVEPGERSAESASFTESPVVPGDTQGAESGPALRVRTGRRGAGELPVEVTSFVGRQSELEAVGKLVKGSRLVTLTGVGGVGKTRVALRVARDAHQIFPDGVWFVELSAVQDPGMVAHSVVQALELDDRTVKPPAEVLQGFLVSRESLLVLDTCEHLIDACAVLVESLLKSAPGVHVLTTSREHLNIVGEEVFVLAPLSVPRPVHPRGSTVESDGVALFVERAHAANQEFSLTPDNREAVGRLCAMLDGIPLALELAAVRLRSMSVEQIMERLDHSFTPLGFGRRTALPRQQTMRATMDWSYHLCSSGERLLWARLSVFSGSFRLDAVEAVCCDRELPRAAAADLLSGLVEKSVLQWEDGISGTRLRLLDVVRQYGAEQLWRRGEPERLRIRHRDHYLGSARRFEDGWFGPNQLSWCRLMRLEHDNIRSAIDFCLSRPEEHRAGLDLVGRLWWYWTSCGLYAEGRHYLDRFLSLNQEPGAERVRALWACGHVAMGQGDADAVHRVAVACRSLAAASGDGLALGFSQHLLGTEAALRGDLDKAAVLTAGAVRLQRDTGSGANALAMCLIGRGFVHLLRGELEAAVGVLEEQRSLSDGCGEVWTRAWGDSLRSSVDLARGDIGSAVTHAWAALTVRYQLCDSLGFAMCIETLAQAALAGGDARRAVCLLAAGQRIWQMSGPPQLGSPELRAARVQCEQAARELIGDASYESAYSRGAELSLDEVLAYAYDAVPGPGDPPPPSNARVRGR
ncbi:BTAD domain-containing putative transcriptional regulator [Streptomyces sp. NPDC001914]|uniref:AfsR/SARP family transcriptional regulator n=1 Tax=Streptomyces sp. NPDC001914 TaxID=3364623 RepID=UPI0036AF7E3D